MEVSYWPEILHKTEAIATAYPDFFLQRCYVYKRSYCYCVSRLFSTEMLCLQKKLLLLRIQTFFYRDVMFTKEAIATAYPDFFLQRFYVYKRSYCYCVSRLFSTEMLCLQKKLLLLRIQTFFSTEILCLQKKLLLHHSNIFTVFCTYEKRSCCTADLGW